MCKCLGIFAAALCLVLGLGPQASAQPAGAIAFAPTSAGLTVDGVHFSVSDVVQWDNASYGGATACNLANVCLYMVPGGGPEPSIIIEAAIGSSLVPIDSYSCTSADFALGGGACNNGDHDLSATVTATVLSGTPLTSASVTLTGSTPAGQGGGVNISEGLTGAPGCSAGLMTDLASPPASCAFTSPSTSVTGNKDVGLGPFFFAVGDYSLATVTEGFTRVPEPASLASLLFGAAALAAVRRRTRRIR